MCPHASLKRAPANAQRVAFDGLLQADRSPFLARAAKVQFLRIDNTLAVYNCRQYKQQQDQRPHAQLQHMPPHQMPRWMSGQMLSPMQTSQPDPAVDWSSMRDIRPHTYVCPRAPA